MKKTYRAVLFDLDGTLLDNNASLHQAYRKLCTLYPKSFSSPFRLSEEGMIALYRVKDADPVQLLKKYCRESGWDLERSPEAIYSFWADMYLDCSVLYEESLPLLQYLRGKSYSMGVVTNGDATRQSRKLASGGIGKWMNACFISDLVGIEKPNPKIFRLALDAIGAKAEETLMVGNNPATDIQGAKNAGMDSFLIAGREPNFATYSGQLKDLYGIL